jgi:heat shock protein HtpX
LILEKLFIENPTPNAFATGRNPKHASVAATTGILQILSEDELAGVMAHELAHVNNRDILIASIAATIAPIAAMVVQLAISRSREYAADDLGARICEKPLSLAHALGKLDNAVEMVPMQGGNPSTAHLFIVNPFKGGLMGLFSTHPPMEERIRRLELLASEIA